MYTIHTHIVSPKHNTQPTYNIGIKNMYLCGVEGFGDSKELNHNKKRFQNINRNYPYSITKERRRNQMSPGNNTGCPMNYPRHVPHIYAILAPYPNTSYTRCIYVQ